MVNCLESLWEAQLWGATLEEASQISDKNEEGEFSPALENKADLNGFMESSLPCSSAIR